MAADDSARANAGPHREHLAERPARTEDELDLPLGEAHRLHRSRQRDLRREVQRLVDVDGAARGGHDSGRDDHGRGHRSPLIGVGNKVLPSPAPTRRPAVLLEYPHVPIELPWL